jgi:hypothetical protein
MKPLGVGVNSASLDGNASIKPKYVIVQAFLTELAVESIR